VSRANSNSPRAQISQPHLADWYAHAVIGRNVPGGTETSYIDEYFAGARPRRADLGPLHGGWRILKFTSTRIRR
jgi:hypothetical protein